MRTLPTELQASLESGVTTLCWCWRVERQDGGVLGFTDHDRDVLCEGVTYRAASAHGVGDAAGQAGFAPGSAAFGGVLESALLTETDLANGRFDDAAVELRRVDWRKPANFYVVWSGHLGEVRRTGHRFEAELRGLAAGLDRTVGRIVQRRCDAELGDARCGVDLNTSAHAATGAIAHVLASRRFTASGLSAFAVEWFTHGDLTWTSGANAGARFRVSAHRLQSGEATLELATAPASPLAAGDAFTIRAGCDKRWRTCHDKFANVLNFRGFPMMPGDDWLFGGPDPDGDHNGGSLWTNREL